MFWAVNLYATRPTVHASNLTFNNLMCNSVNIQWTNGNGNARIIFVKEGSAPDFQPIDLDQYTPNSIFGTSLEYNVKNYIVYNSTGTNFVKVDNLLPGKTYYFTIYEHNNSGTSTLYYTTGAPTISITTLDLKLNFNVVYYDSCQQKNSYQFTNTSTSTIPGVTYTFDYGFGNTSTQNVDTHSFTNAGLVPVRIIANPSLGCPSSLTKNVRVYNKRVAFIDFNIYKDTVQCFEGNYFDIDPTPVVSPLLAPYKYNWNFGDNTTSSFKRMKKSYKASGRYNVELEIVTTINNQATACRDTLMFDVVVLPNPAGGFNINKSQQCLGSNFFEFENPNTNLTSFKWYYSNGDSSSLRVTNYVFSDTGTYRIIHVAKSNQGCFGKDTQFVQIKEDFDPSFSGLDTLYCVSNQSINLVSATPGGVFSGYPNNNNSLVPNIPGTFTLKYVYEDAFCADSSEKVFRVQANPNPNLGRDTAICSGGTYNLNANETGTYLWNLGQTSSNIDVSFSGIYSVRVQQGQCFGNDSIQVIFNSAPVLTMGSDTILCKDAILKLVATNPLATYKWNTGSTDSFIFVSRNGKYKVRVENPCGVAEDSIFVTIQTGYCDLFMVNAFSPDNDLINNVFMPRGRNITVQSFQIFNRWGELVFETKENNVGWNGQYNNKPAEAGLYIWKLFYTVPNGPFIKKSNAFGQVLLIR